MHFLTTQPDSEMEKKSGKVFVNFGDGNEIESELKNPLTHTYTGTGTYQINITYYSSNLVKIPDAEKAYTIRVLDTASLSVEEKNGFIVFSVGDFNFHGNTLRYLYKISCSIVCRQQREFVL